ncbi:N-alpha-acetyltransferase 15, NatA auxiliary subunit, putative [Plasmodium vinckei vinckei]|uniref:N-alpha-acetyltransferase 15, NatA auxiliary subunit, putative n=1 Tax=Plasmodium vinckei vinckei TaxID=54757 RepID=A0A449C0Y6_PLAVN|nr:N-alpha-acetyltransferase 15, NatA auxiliary subunit, putative [Plasmodium vinckei vinckei]KEG03855.1 hypothetical protein YYE_00757 [Plasmodium vinckei vinckei]VEV59350.1 N-alpha-acetyltransferase 15, NatA auxiliary subunit, putative [Plasmodium vinckei vinckei]
MKKDGNDNNKLSTKEMNNFRLMTQMIELKKYKKALKTCEQILKKYPKNGETLSVKGYLLNLIDENNKEEAFKYAKEGIINNLSSSFCWYLYGCLYKNYKNYEEALKCYMKSIKLNRHDHKAVKEASVLLLYLNKYEQFKDLRIDTYKDSAKGPKDKALVIFSYHLLKQYEKCYHLIKQVEEDLSKIDVGNDQSDKTNNNNNNIITANEKHQLLVYMSEILLEGKMYKECIQFLNKHKQLENDKLWYNQMLGLIYLYENDMSKANTYFKEAFSVNSENLNILLLILFTEKEIYIDEEKNGSNNKNGELEGSDNGSLSSLFYLDYKDEHKMNEKVQINENVKVLLHESILDIYGSKKNLKLLSYIDKNILNDYVCHNLEMKKYDVYTVSELKNFTNINPINPENFKKGIDESNIDKFIELLKEDIKKECQNISNNTVENYNNIQWSNKIGFDLFYYPKKRVEKSMDILYFYKIKNLNDKEEKCIETYFTNLQNKYENSNLLKIFPLYFYNETKFSYYIEKLFRNLCFQKCFTIFNYIKPILTYKNVKILLFLLHKYIKNYDETNKLCEFDNDYASRDNNSNSYVINNIEKNDFEKREDSINETLNGDLDKNKTSKDGNCCNGTIEINNNKSDEVETEENYMSNEKNKMKDMIGSSSSLGMYVEGMQNGNINNKNKMNKGTTTQVKDKKPKEEIKPKLNKKILTKEERDEIFMLCIYSFISQLYDYINCVKDSLYFIDKCINNIKHKINEEFKYELIFTKGLIYKRNGNYLMAFKYLDICRNHNIGDRFINSKTVKVGLKCGLIKYSRKMATLFTNPLDNNFLKNITDTQCFWIEYALALSYFNRHMNIHLNGSISEQGEKFYQFKTASSNDISNDVSALNLGQVISDENGGEQITLSSKVIADNDLLSLNEHNDYSKSLFFLHLGHKQFIDIHEDHLCFYYYVLRKVLYRSYKHLLYMSGHVFSSRFYRRFGKLLIKICIHMNDIGMKPKTDQSKNNKKKNKSNTTPNPNEDKEIYEHMKKDPLENAMIYMNTFLSQPNADISVYALNYEIERRRGNDYIKLINIINEIKKLFPYHNYHYKLAPLISHYLYSVSKDNVDDEKMKEIAKSLNTILGLNYDTYNEEILKKERTNYINNFMKFFNENKKGDLRYLQSALEIYIHCNEKISDDILLNKYMDPRKNKLGRCFKFFTFLINHKKNHSELSEATNRFKELCKEVYPLATAFQ